MKERSRLERLRPAQFLGWLLLAAALLACRGAWAAQDFLEADQAFRLSVQETGDGRARLQWSVAPGYYLYRERLAVRSAEGPVLPLQLPAGERKDDPNFGTVEVYHRDVAGVVDAGGLRELQVEWQGCAEEGLCYPPQRQRVRLDGPPAGASASSPSAPPAGPWSDAGISRLWAGHALWWTLPLAFALGLGLAFTPCVLPMVPIVSGMVVGQGASVRRALLLSTAFVIPMALVYAGLGVLAAAAGARLQALLQAPVAVLGFALLFVLLAFAMFGLFTLQLPAVLRDRLAGVSARGGSVAGAAALGTLSALLVGPCMTAPLAGTLLYIAQTGDLLQGALLLLALGLGMGVPLVVISALGARWLPRPGPWMERVRGFFGFLLLGTAVWMAERVVPASIALLLWGALLASAALTVWHVVPHAPGRAGTLLLRSGALVAGLWGAAMVFGAAAGGSDRMRPLAPMQAVADGASAPAFEVVRDPATLQARLAAARAQGRPALVDFSAEWCTSCKTLEREVFGDPRVLRALAGTQLLRADVTAGDAGQQELLRRYAVMGPPTVLLFDAGGAERRADRLVGEFAADALLLRVAGGGDS